MADYDLLILNGIVITDTERRECDIAVKDELIVKVEPRGTLTISTAKRVIDANGGYVMVSVNTILCSYAFKRY